MKLDPEFMKMFLAAKPRKVQVGYSGLALLSARTLAKGQLGYSRHPDGRDLTGTGSGDWKPSWVVVGNELSGGEPVFIDLTQPEFPAYTAMHGQGEWDPMPVAQSLKGLVLGLKEVALASRGRESPVALQAHPLSKAERRQLKQRLRCLGGELEQEFWLSWFEA